MSSFIINPYVFSGYTANAVDFTPATLGTLALSGVADSSTGIISTYVRLDGGDGTNMTILSARAGTTDVVRLSRGGANTFILNLSDAAGTSACSMTSTVGTFTSGSAWLHVLLAWDTNFSAGNKILQMYIDDATMSPSKSDGNPAFNVDYTPTSWAIGSRTDIAQQFDGCLAEFYFAPGQYLDISNSANRLKFRSSANRPVNIGLTGDLPTGTAPAVYLNNPAASFTTNKGTGGNFTVVTGALATASSAP